jgi:hypothetical protein
MAAESRFSVLTRSGFHPSTSEPAPP